MFSMTTDPRFLTLAAAILFFVGIGCDSQTYRSYRGNVVEVVYSKGDTLQDGQWIKVDQHEFTHVQFVEDSRLVDHPLPTTYIVLDSTGGRGFGQDVEPEVMSLHLAQELNKVNDDLVARGDGSPTYNMGPEALIRLEGTLRLSKSNDGLVNVQVPYNYPADIRVLE